MRRRSLTRLLLAAVGILVLAPSAFSEEDPGWPREFKEQDGAALTVYQPQVEGWENYTLLHARVAFTIKMPGEEEESVGGMKLDVETLTDHEERTVTLDNLKISALVLPGIEDPAAAQKAEQEVRRLFPTGPVTISLDRVLANLGREHVKSKRVEVNNDPPKIIISHEEAILVYTDGDPMLEPVDEGSELLVVINTASTLLLHTKTAKYYLLYEESWLEAPQLAGPWTLAANLPAAFTKLPDDETWKEAKTKVPGKPLQADEVPTVHATQEFTELIVIDGAEDLSRIPDTTLLWVVNTESDLFRAKDGHYYFLVSGRWFRSKGLDGPWVFCTSDLPPDFKKIAEDHDAGRVLVSVPGTQQALEAAIAAQIPQMAEIKRDDAKIEATYDGKPEFKEIEGTKTVYYAVNTSLDVFRVGDRFYCCYDGVWFISNAAEGPWAACDKVPAEIYTIPSSSSKYHVTYVYVYKSSPTVVYGGYTSGYLGVVVVSGLVIWGTAWRIHRHRSFWRHHYHWRRHHHYRAHRHAYGHGRHYNHRTGRYDRSRRSRGHHTARATSRGTYQRGDKGVHRSTGRQKPSNAKRGTPVKKDRDLYAGRDGNVYDKKGNSYERHGKGGGKPNTSQQKSMQRDSRARSSGSRRSTQHGNYQRSRSHGRSRGGGGRRR
ncbi:MAG: hypothetical protein ACYS0K_09295 [Planctomycetota bacterium]|jgi:hypothetical protein